MALQDRGVGRRLSSTWQAAWPTQHAAGRKDMKQKPSCRSREKRPTADRNETTQPAVRASAPGTGWANSCKNSFEVGNVTWLQIASLPHSKAPITCNRTRSSTAGSWQRYRQVLPALAWDTHCRAWHPMPPSLPKTHNCPKWKYSQHQHYPLPSSGEAGFVWRPSTKTNNNTVLSIPTGALLTMAKLDR